jgi:hypothetical protein
MYKNVLRFALVGLTGGGLVWSQVHSPYKAADDGQKAGTAPGAVERAAFFQSGDIGLPPFPGSNGPGDDRTVTPPILPDQGSLTEAMPSDFDQGGLQQPPPAMPNYPQPTAQLPNRLQSNISANQLAAFNPQQNFNSQPIYNDLRGYNSQFGYDQPNSRPIGNPPQPFNQQNNAPFRTVSNENNSRQVLPNPSGSQQRNPTAVSGFGTNVRATEIATGLPYVTPSPRTGRYPTSAYNPAMFRTISYQAPVQQQVSMQQQPSTAVIANTAPVLPQNSGVSGVAPPYQGNPYQANQCGPGVIPTYPAPGAVPGTYIPGTITPNLTPGMYSPNNSGYSPIFSLGQENYNVQIGRGIVGQPTVYVPGQPFRNFLRYLSP